MGKQIFINLPVKDLKKTSTFFEKMGYSFDPQFSNEDAKCMIISDNIIVMLLVEPFFSKFTGKEIPDTSRTSEVILSLNAESRQAVDEFLQKCISAGGKDTSKPNEMEFMYTRSFEDPDGHFWEVFWMDEARMRSQQPTAQIVDIG
jgi:predicted lactoylglutathione lyase